MKLPSRYIMKVFLSFTAVIFVWSGSTGKKMTDQQKYELGKLHCDSLRKIRDNYLRTSDSLSLAVKENRPSIHSDSIKVLKSSLKSLQKREQYLDSVLDCRRKWQQRQLPGLLKTADSVAALSLFTITGNRLRETFSTLESFDEVNELKHAMEKIKEREKQYNSLQELRKLTDSPLKRKDLESAIRKRNELKELLPENEKELLSKEISVPLANYADCATTARTLIENFNSDEKVRDSRKRAQENPVSATNMKSFFLKGFDNFMQSNGDAVKSLEKVPYFKRIWEEYRKEITISPFDTGKAEKEILSLDF